MMRPAGSLSLRFLEKLGFLRILARIGTAGLERLVGVPGPRFRPVGVPIGRLVRLRARIR